MEPTHARSLTSQLADDFAWLEQHCLRSPGQVRAAAAVRLAAALVRNCLGPFVDRQPATPLHIAVVGGAGAGKSTVANLVSGAAAAEANPQAGFTRHPVGFTTHQGPLEWTGHLGFLGPLQLLDRPGPSNLDEDVYQIRRVPSDGASQELLRDFVVWDCPDMTTWAAAGGPDGGYVLRLFEAAGLADVLIYVASDERYNDEVPTQFLRLLLQAGKPVVAVLTKMREENAPAIVEHFQKEVVAHLPQGVVGAIAIPFLTRDELVDPARTATRFRIPLLNQISVLLNPPAVARRRSAVGALQYLVQNQELLLGVARADVAALQGWQALVDAGRATFDERYQREYLSSEKFRGFDEALVRLVQLLDLPGVGKAVSGALHVLRTPYRLLKGWLTSAVNRPENTGRPEQPVLEESLSSWLDGLRRESARRAATHPLWAHVANAFASGGLAEQARAEFQSRYRNFQGGLSEEVDRTARNIYEQLEKNPKVLNSLRYGKFAIDVGAIGATLAAGGLNWHDIILVPLVASLTQQLVEVCGKQWVDSEREKTRQRQQMLLMNRVSGPMAAWLAEWPASGGSEFEQLQRALQRIPQSIRELEGLMRTLA